MGFGKKEIHLSVQEGTWNWVLGGGFHLLKCLALGIAGNISQSNGISTETSVSAARKQITTISSAVGVRKSE